MPIIVQKYGGTSLADAERIRNVARRIVRAKRDGNRVVAVVSAMGDSTDDLISLAHQVTKSPPSRELDMLLTAGERVSMALLSMAIIGLGERAISFTGSQVGIITDSSHTRARIMEIKADRIRQALQQGTIVIVAGFQGVSLAREITTLGRGGSDTTAVALAAALGAKVCELYSDVPGVFTADPRLVKSARRLARIPFDEMIELAGAGAQVLHVRAAELAAKFNMPVVCRSSFTDDPGTFIGKGPTMERIQIRGIAHDPHLAMLTLWNAPKSGAALPQLVAKLSESGVQVKSFFHGPTAGSTVNLFFVIASPDIERAQEVFAKNKSKAKAARLTVNRGLGAITLVGPGVGGEMEIVSKMLSTLSALKIHVEGLITSETRITGYLDRKHLERALLALHKAFIG
ncbi:MAG: aspartate kinase [Candidatus Edwardsbacteria bacterium]|nr:aspartate kinase [Candidatus Edwardsbacteria bacterium]